MAIARNGTTAVDSGFVSSGDTISWNHTTSGGANRFLVVGVASSVAALTMKADGADMTQVDHLTLATGVELYLYVIHAPSASTVALAFKGISTISTGRALSADYTGAQQSSTVDAFQHDHLVNGTDFDIGTHLTTPELVTVAANCWTVGVVYNNWSNDVTARADTGGGVGAGGLILANVELNAGGTDGSGGLLLIDSNANIATGGTSASLGGTQTATSAFWGGIVASFTVAGAAPTTSGSMLLLGAG